MEYPPNSKMRGSDPPKKEPITRVTSAEAVRRKKSLGRQFRDTFIVGDAKSAMQYVIFDVLLPAAKDMFVEAGSQGIERLIFGETRRHRGMRNPSSGATGYVSYNRMAMTHDRPSPIGQHMSKRARARHDFDEIVLESRSEAEDVIDRLFDLVSRYDHATVADLYELTGLTSTHTDHKWGWSDLRGASVSRLRNQGYLLNLPDPTPLS